MSDSIQELHGGIFHLRTTESSLVLAAGPVGHIELLWFGDPLELTTPAQARSLRRTFQSVPGVTVTHGRSRDGDLTLNRQPLAYSTLGKGDFRAPALTLAGHGTLDLTYRSHRILGAKPTIDGLPSADAEPGSQTLELTLADDVVGLEVLLRWTTFPESGAITHHTVIRNTSQDTVTLTHAASLLMDLPDRSYDVLTFDGWWASEAHLTRTPLGHTTVRNASRTGSSSSEHNPGVLLVERAATETAGRGYGFNLVYSGNHATTLEGGRAGSVRVVSGLNPEGFSWPLTPGEMFATPEAVAVFSAAGTGGISRAFHRFVNRCIVPEHWRGRPRPVVLNNWEGTYFDFDADALVEIAEHAVGLGVETFVLDDGWFGKRNDDTSGLGDWSVNTTKLPGGLGALTQRITALGLNFGLWFEPEAISEDSDLYRAHPEWAIHQEGRAPSEGRNELLLDLTRADVRDHLVETLSGLLDAHPISFVKWDMNRLISDAVPDGFHHRYTLGLYDILHRTFGPRPEILLENCSAGGNRFDLGVLRFGPQVWSSDCTDPVERLSIQRGLSHFYPQSTISAHVSASPNHQTGRATSLDFRFAVSAPYVFGIELDPRTMPADDIAALAERVAWYKEHRQLLQFGEYHRGARCDDGRHQLSVLGDGEALAAYYAATVRLGSEGQLLVSPGLDGAVAAQRAFSGQEPVEYPAGALAGGVPAPPLLEGEAALTVLRGR